MFLIRIILAILSIVLPSVTYGTMTEEDGFILYRRDLLPGLAVTQTDKTTSILYHGETIKTYKNEEFNIALLPHGPKEAPDCYNSLVKNAPSTYDRDRVGMEYLKSCLILKSERIFGRYILLYAPSIDGNRVSVYDMRNKKFFHFLLNTVLSYRKNSDGLLVFLTRDPNSWCGKSFLLFDEGKITKLTDSCMLSSDPSVPAKILSYRVFRNILTIYYHDMILINNEFVESNLMKRFFLPLQ